MNLAALGFTASPFPDLSVAGGGSCRCIQRPQPASGAISPGQLSAHRDHRGFRRPAGQPDGHSGDPAGRTGDQECSGPAGGALNHQPRHFGNVPQLRLGHRHVGGNPAGPGRDQPHFAQSLPQGSTFDIRRMNTNVFPVVAYSLTSDKLPLLKIREIAETELLPIAVLDQGRAARRGRRRSAA